MAKSQFTSFLFIYHTLLYAYHNPDAGIKVTIFYFPLEETPERIMQRFMSYILYDLTDGEIIISPRDLRSSSNNKPVPLKVLELLKTEEFQNRLKFFEDNIIFDESSNPTGIMKVCKEYAEKHGTTYYKKIKIKNDFGEEVEVNKFDRYEMENPNEYRIIIIDTINLIDTEKGLTIKQSMDKLSEYLAKILRNRYCFSPVVIQQQAMAGEVMDAFKGNDPDKYKSSVANLGDSKYTARDSNVVIGIFNPSKYLIEKYKGYDIKKFGNRIRFIEILCNRDGEMGGMCPLFFNGAVCSFTELPRPEDTTGIERVYAYIRKLNKKSTSFFMFNFKNNLLLKLIKLFN